MRSRFAVCPWDVLTHVLLLDCGKLVVFALKELFLARWSSRSRLSNPGRIPLPAGSQDFFDHVVLVRVGDRGDDPHLLSTALADLGVDLPDFGDEARPVFSAKPDELRILLGGDELGGRCGGTLIFPIHPTELPANGGRECAVGMDAALVPQRNVREEHGEELDAAGELVVAPKPRMELGASVKDATVVLVLEPFKRHRRPLEVLQKDLELLALACGDAAVGSQRFSRFQMW